MSKRNVYVMQDGADFYIYDKAAGVEAGTIDVAHATNHVSDYDMQGAMAARVWFKNTYCKKHNFNPSFEE